MVIRKGRLAFGCITAHDVDTNKRSCPADTPPLVSTVVYTNDFATSPCVSDDPSEFGEFFNGEILKSNHLDLRNLYIKENPLSTTEPQHDRNHNITRIRRHIIQDVQEGNLRHLQ
jgi:hypothetical protein